jgi:hypothetical protein
VNAAPTSGVFFFLLCRVEDFSENFFWIFSSVAAKNIWPPIGRTTYDSLLSDRARDQALDIERRSARRRKENRFPDDVNRLNRRTT